jgi:DNA-binding CsgD family transcriptional regulator
VYALLLFWDGRLTDARERLAALHAEALDRGDEHSLPFVLFQLARVELMLGDWEAAELHALQCGESVDASGQVGRRAYALTIEALVAAHLGHEERARELIAVGLELAEANGVQPAALEILATKGLLELSLGEPADATFAEVARRVEASGLKEPALFRWQGDAVEAFVLAGRPEEARAFYTPDRAWSARAAAWLGADAPADPVDEPFEAARLALVRGALARRHRQWRAAREQLTAARDAFATLGARLWVRRAQEELSRVGGRAADDGLTPTERRIAELIAAGRTYKEVADALFISPKTVQWNLSKVYKKLGIKSRAELPGRLIPATSPVSPAGEEP